MAVIQPRFVQYHPENPRRAGNIHPAKWELFREAIYDLHHRGSSKDAILTSLLRSNEVAHTDFRPSINQLVRQMKAWGLRANERQTQDSSSSSASLSTESLAQSSSLPSDSDQITDSSMSDQSHDMQCSPLQAQEESTFGETMTNDLTVQPHWLSDISPSSSPPSSWALGIDGASDFPALPLADIALADSVLLHDFNPEDSYETKVRLTESKETARDQLCEIESSMSSLSIKTRTSCNFERVTEMPSVLGLAIYRQMGTQNVKIARRGLDFAEAAPSYYQTGRVFKHLFYRQRPGESLEWQHELEQKIVLQTFHLAVVLALETSYIAVPIYHSKSAKFQSFSERRIQQLAPVHLRSEAPADYASHPLEVLKPIALSVRRNTRLDQGDRIDFGWPIRFSYNGLVSDLGHVAKSSMKRFNRYSHSVMRPSHGNRIEPVDSYEASCSLSPLTTETVDSILAAMEERGSWPGLVEQ